MQDLTPEAERLVVHLDEDLAVIEKPAGLVVHSAPSHKGETLVDLLEGIAGGGEGGRPGIVHRLDKNTSGLMVVARNEESLRALSRMVKAREVVREYTALVEGEVGSRTGTIDAPLGRHRRQRTKRAVKGSGSREARTHFEVIEALPADRWCTHASRPAALTRSASTSPRSAIRSPGIPSTGRGGDTGWSASSCTPHGLSSRTPAPKRR
jgi:Pseudouridylate synthases, 23S RNA-specific